MHINWLKFKSDAPKQSLAAWDLVCRPKNKGRLGILNLAIQNQGLLLKQLHKFNNKQQVAWVQLIWDSYYDGVVPHATVLTGSFWWKDILKLGDHYRSIATMQINMGDSALFWLDAWHVGGSSRPLNLRLPRLFSFVLDDKLSVRDFMQNQDLFSMFHLPIPQEAAAELELLEGWLFNL